MSQRVRFKRRDILWLSSVLLIVTLLSGTCFSFAARSRAIWAEQSGIVIEKSVRLPGLKQVAPLHWIFTIRKPDGARVAFEVSKEIYDSVALGVRVRRDKFGNLVTDR